MKTKKIYILTILSLVIITLFSCVYATNTVNQATTDMGNGVRNAGNAIGNGIADTASGIGNAVNNIGEGVVDTTKDAANGIKNGINNMTDNMDNNNANNASTNNASNMNTASSNYSTNRVAYNDTVNVFGMNVSRTGFILFVIALASITVAVLIFSYISQNNDNYRDNS